MPVETDSSNECDEIGYVIDIVATNGAGDSDPATITVTIPPPKALDIKKIVDSLSDNLERTESSGIQLEVMFQVSL